MKRLFLLMAAMCCIIATRAELVFHAQNLNPQKTEIGYMEDCWEDVQTGKFYLDEACTQHSHPMYLVFYALFDIDPVYNFLDFFRAENFNYYCIDERLTYDCRASHPNRLYLYESDKDVIYCTEFVVTGTNVGNAVVKWFKESKYGGMSSDVSIYVNREVVHTYENAPATEYLTPLPGLKTGDVVKFEVNKHNEENKLDFDEYYACLGYTRTSDFGYLPVTIKLNDASKAVGYADPEYTWTVANGRTPEGVELPPFSFSREEGEEPGTYRIHASVAEGVDTPYDITFVDAILYIDELVHHSVCEPEYTQRGYNQECCENCRTGKLYADYAMAEELDAARVVTYKELFKDPIVNTWGFQRNGSKVYDGVRYNNVLEKVYQNYEMTICEATYEIKEKYVDEARMKVYIADAKSQPGNFEFVVRVNGVNAFYHREYGALNNHYAVPLPGLKLGDEVLFKVCRWTKFDKAEKVTVAVSLEYALSEEKLFIPITLTADDKTKAQGADDPVMTCSVTGGKTYTGYELPLMAYTREPGEEYGNYAIHPSVPEGVESAYDVTFADGNLEILNLVHHEAEEPTLHTLGYMECWEHVATSRFFADAAGHQEISAAVTVIYANPEHHPSEENDGFDLSWDTPFSGVVFGHAYSHQYNASDASVRYVEFKVIENGINNARIKWYKNFTSLDTGKYTVRVQVNGNTVYTFNQDDVRKDENFFVVPLPNLLNNSKVRFTVDKEAWSTEGHDLTIAACLEYTTMIVHEVSAPTISERGYLTKCYEDPATQKLYFYDNHQLELNPATVYSYLPQAEDPVLEAVEFDTDETRTFLDNVFNWPASTYYDRYACDTRYVDFVAHGTDIDNARLKVANVAYTRGTAFMCNIYVNSQLYISFVPDYFSNKEAIQAFALPDLNPLDVVRFEIVANYEPAEGEYGYRSPEFWASLEFTRTSEEDILVDPTLFLTANEDPDHRGDYYTTFYDSQNEYTLGQGNKAYIGEVVGEELRLTPISNGIIPQGEAVLIKAEAADVQLDLSSDGAEKSALNMLQGTDVEMPAPASCYIFSYAQNGLGFYQYAEGKTLAAHKAYLTYSAPQGARGLRMVFTDDEENGIERIEADADGLGEGVIYSLSGVRLNSLQPGLNIVNGKKVTIVNP